MARPSQKESTKKWHRLHNRRSQTRQSPISMPPPRQERTGLDPMCNKHSREFQRSDRGGRWYDVAYRIAAAISRFCRSKRGLRFLDRPCLYLQNWLIPFEEFERFERWPIDDPHHNFRIPPSETAVIPTIWITEIFLPAQIPDLKRVFRRRRWARMPVGLSGNSEVLAESRLSASWSWWRAGEIAANNSSLWWPGASRERLPDGIEAITIHVAQIQSGITLVTGEFRIDDAWSQSVHRALHETPKCTLRGSSRTRV